MRELFPQPLEKQLQLNQDLEKSEHYWFSLFFFFFYIVFQLSLKKYAEVEKSDLLVQGLLKSIYVFGAAVSFSATILLLQWECSKEVVIKI